MSSSTWYQIPKCFVQLTRHRYRLLWHNQLNFARRIQIIIKEPLKTHLYHDSPWRSTPSDIKKQLLSMVSQVSPILDLCQTLFVHPREIRALCWSPQDSISAFNIEKSVSTFPQLPWALWHHSPCFPTLQDFTEFIYTKICMGLFEDLKVGFVKLFGAIFWGEEDHVQWWY